MPTFYFSDSAEEAWFSADLAARAIVISTTRSSPVQLILFAIDLGVSHLYCTLQCAIPSKLEFLHSIQ
jgi:hypothetical protein